MLRTCDNWKEWMEPDDMICANCAHWKDAAKVAIPMDDGFMERRLCRYPEFYGDAGDGAITLVGPKSDCTGAGTCAFIPSEDYLESVEADAPFDDYGVRPGFDHPATLFAEPQRCAV